MFQIDGEGGGAQLTKLYRKGLPRFDQMPEGKEELTHLANTTPHPCPPGNIFSEVIGKCETSDHHI